MNKFNNQFATQKLREEISESINEQSVTGTGATFTAGTGEQTAPRATKKVFRKKVKKESKSIPSDWTDAKSIPNRPTNGGFIYKQLFEELSKFVKEYQNQTNYKITISPTDAQEVAEIIKGEFRNMGVELIDSQTIIIDDWDTAYDMLNTFDQYGIMITGHDIPFDPEEDDDVVEPEDEETDYIKYRKDPQYYQKNYDEKGTGDFFQRKGLNESYSKFKTETKTRGKADQFHQAIREVKNKVQQINKMYEYVSRLKTELSEGEEGLKYKIHTEKALSKIKEMVSELNQKIKRFK